MTDIRIISVLLASFLVSGQVSALCNVAVLDACLARYQPYLIGFAVANIDQSNITVACRLLGETTSCVTNNATCTDTEAPTLSKWVGQRKTIEYICNNDTGRTGYLNNVGCLANSVFLSGLQTCLGNTTDSKARADIACKTLYSQLSCVNTTSQSTCGDNTTQFMNSIGSMRFSPAVTVQAPGCTGLCNSAALDTCLAPFKAVYWGAFSSATVNSSNIDTACSTFNDAVSCVATRTKCPDTDPISMVEWTGKRAIISNNCGAGRADYLKIQPCISTPAFTTSFSACSTPIDPAIQADTACSLYKGQLACMVRVAQTVCGTDAAVFFGKNLPSISGPAIRLQYPACVITDINTLTSAGVSLSMKVSLSLLIIVPLSLLQV